MSEQNSERYRSLVYRYTNARMLVMAANPERTRGRLFWYEIDNRGVALWHAPRPLQVVISPKADCV